MTGYQSLPANVALGLADQYAIQNSWLTTDVGQLEVCALVPASFFSSSRSN